jgi:hypothetical protein
MTNVEHHTELIELRQYLLHRGQREHLIDLFEREFIEPQEALGMNVIGQFRDPERPDYFVWLRGFANLEARHRSLTDFYGGAVWAEHRNEANETMIDSDNVMLLRHVPGSDALPSRPRSERDKPESAAPIVVAVQQVDRIDPETIDTFRSQTVHVLEQAGCRALGLYATELVPNTFTRLPVRTDRSIVWFGATTTIDAVALRRALPLVDSDRHALHVLIPTSRSALDGTP